MVLELPYGPTQPQPEQALDSPETLVINALIGTGEFRPSQYGLDKAMLANHDKVWEFCASYQNQTGLAPPRQLLARSFPDFEQLAGVDVAWAADVLRASYHERTMRLTLKNALSAIHDKDLDAAREFIAEAAKPTLMARPRALSVYDESTVAGQALKVGWTEPWEALHRHTQGIGRGELRYVGARQGEGKSWIAPVYAVHLAEQGARVAILTLEIPKRVYARRIQLVIARGDVALQQALKGTDERLRTAALHSLAPMPGTVDLLDPSDVRMTTKAVELAGVDYDVVIVDHVGLLRDTNGKQAIEDWRVMAAISNRLKELTLELNVAIIGCAQINRAGETMRGRPPKTSQLSQSDALGQDGDVIHLLKRMIEHGSSMLHDIPKNRGGFSTRFYTKFLPATAEFEEISKTDAEDLARQDEDRAGDR